MARRRCYVLARCPMFISEPFMISSRECVVLSHCLIAMRDTAVASTAYASHSGKHSCQILCVSIVSLGLDHATASHKRVFGQSIMAARRADSSWSGESSATCRDSSPSVMPLSSASTFCSSLLDSVGSSDVAWVASPSLRTDRRPFRRGGEIALQTQV